MMIAAPSHIPSGPAKALDGSVLTALLVGVLLLFPPPGLVPAPMPAAVVTLVVLTPLNVLWRQLFGYFTPAG